jgi:DNA replication protein
MTILRTIAISLGNGNAFGINACEAGYRVLFIRMIELLNSLMVARTKGNISKLLKKYYRIDLLIIDDFLLTDTTPTEQKDLMEIF